MVTGMQITTPSSQRIMKSFIFQAPCMIGSAMTHKIAHNKCFVFCLKRIRQCSQDVLLSHSSLMDVRLQPFNRSEGVTPDSMLFSMLHYLRAKDKCVAAAHKQEDPKSNQ